MPSSTATLFISAVTDEFKSCRDAAVKWLDAPDTRIETQERFLALGQTTLVKLSEYIHQCDAVVHLVGDRSGNKSGSIANSFAVKALLETHVDLPHRLGLAVEFIYCLSYTQWEAWLALYHKKRLLIAVPEKDAPRDGWLDDDAAAQAQAENQAAHLAALASRSCYPEFRFANSDQLCLGLIPLRDRLTRSARSELALNNIVSLDEYRAGLAGFRRFLSSSNLPFQPPPHGHPCHPEELLKQLETSRDARGVLLAGAGGVGKTRTTFETAQLAETRGWRVIYALPGQPAVTAEKIVEAVYAHGPGKTMVVIEYLDQMPDLDIGVLRRYLVQVSTQRGIRFGLLANCRPGFLIKSNLERDATFDTVTLAPTASEAHDLSRFVAIHSAPQALAILGESELMRLCGNRSIIALLVAQQLEQLAESSALQPNQVTAVRSGDLAHWLRRRLAEDGLVVPQAESIWHTPTPPSHLVAAAAALACAPDEKAALVAASASALGAIGQPQGSAAHLVGVLIAVGWLEREGEWLNVVHDVVADELVEQSIFDLDAVRLPELGALLSPIVRRARCVGRIARTFTRVEGAVSDARGRALREQAGGWVRENAGPIGAILSEEEVNSGAYALGAVVGGSVFEDVTIEQWSQIVSPWLAKHRMAFEARHFFFRGLRGHHEAIHTELVPIAVEWLDRWGRGRPASFVFGPLLRIMTAPEMSEYRVVESALAWLKHFAETFEAEFVLSPLLYRADLDGESAERTVALALAWLELFAGEPEVRYVLAPLLARTDLPEGSLAWATEFALQWLVAFGANLEAGFVLEPLLNRFDREPEVAAQVADFALRWLQEFALKVEAGFVLAPLLGRKDLDWKSLEKGVHFALTWIECFAEKSQARFVITALLSREDVKGAPAERLQRCALQWLEGNIDKPLGQTVMIPLLSRADMQGEVAEKALSLALQRREAFVAPLNDGFILEPLLRRKDLTGVTASSATTWALRWLESFGTTPQAQFVLTALLGRKDASSDSTEQIIAYSFGWLEIFAESHESNFVLRALLMHDAVMGETARHASALALRWIERFGDTREGSYVFPPLLALSGADAEVMRQAVDHALRWLERYEDETDAGFMLDSLLHRTELESATMARLQSIAVKWMQKFTYKPQTQFVLQSLLTHANPQSDLEPQLVAATLQWLDLFSTTTRVDAGFVFPLLWRRKDLDEFAVQHSLVLAFRWLDHFPGRFYAAPADTASDGSRGAMAHTFRLAMERLEKLVGSAVLVPVFNPLQKGLDGEGAGDRVGLALDHLSGSIDRPETGLLLYFLLSHEELKGMPALRAFALAQEWLKRFSDWQSAGFLYALLLNRTDVPRSISRNAIGLALRWVEKFAGVEAFYVWHVLLKRNDLEKAVVGEALPLALQWVEAFSDHPRTQFVMGRLLSRPDLADELARRSVEATLKWLERFSETLEALFVLRPLIRNWLEVEAATRSIQRFAIQWVKAFVAKKEASQVLQPLLGSKELEGELLAETVALSSAWLGKFHQSEHAQFIFLTWGLGPNAGRMSPTIREWAMQWVAKFPKACDGVLALALRLCMVPPEEPERREIAMSAVSWAEMNGRHPLIRKVLLALLKYHADLDGVLDGTLSAALAAAARYGREGVRKPLLFALGLLPPEDARVEKIRSLFSQRELESRRS